MNPNWLEQAQDPVRCLVGIKPCIGGSGIGERGAPILLGGADPIVGQSVKPIERVELQEGRIVSQLLYAIDVFRGLRIVIQRI